MTTAFYTDERSAAHTQSGHPEHAGRLEAVLQRLTQHEVLEQLNRVPAVSISDQQIRAVHDWRYLEALEKTAGIPGGAHIGVDTYITPQSYELARLAASGTMAVVDSVLKGEAQNGIAAVRPPGHHATPEQGMGFCLLNNIAIAARHAINAHQLERVAIIDFDVHHGNGTQDVFYEDGQVLFISSHQFPLYPGTGSLEETGRGPGQGYTVNAPLPPGTGDKGIQAVYEQVLFPVVERFKPQLMLISAGFDAHWRDPLANLTLTLTGFDWLSRRLLELAASLCEGKIAFVMEGGYDLEALSCGWLNIANALLGKSEVHDPLGTTSQERALPASLIARLKAVHPLR
jgi:acetoin utilization deacetylase AcuC-like enzyme